MKVGGHVRRAPLLFHTKEDAIDFKTKVAKGTKLKPSQARKPDPCWIYEQGQYRWEGKVSTSELADLFKHSRICHDRLEPEWEQVCRDLYPVVGHYITDTYEQWELGFLKDVHPDRELQVWQGIAKAFTKYRADHPDCDARTVVDLLAGLAAGGTGDDIEALKPYYDGIIRPLSIFESHKQIQLQLSISSALSDAIPEEEIRKLATEWAQKVIHREAERENIVRTKWGEVRIICDFEKYRVLLAFTNESEPRFMFTKAGMVQLWEQQGRKGMLTASTRADAEKFVAWMRTSRGEELTIEEFGTAEGETSTAKVKWQVGASAECLWMVRFDGDKSEFRALTPAHWTVPLGDWLGSDPDHPIPIEALFDETWTGPNLAEDPRRTLADAQVIIEIDVMSRHQFVVYGRKVLEEIVETGVAQELPTIFVAIDQETEELEKPLALVDVVKGHDDYQAG